MLILGINPYTISYIRVVNFRRIGRHPVYYNFRKKKHPVLSLLWGNSPDIFDCIWQRPGVQIVGNNGTVLHTVPCKSRSHAERISTELCQQLSDFVSCRKTKQ